ncbi:hypothetical protein IQ269_16275 [Tychonema sp. LEGE 07199]|uniref:hypothetical protein n=1 Tax=unclassified Tychonema TaxID=2642144 RepID=UPI00187FA18F|nr:MULTISPECIES: hypothetical protein [unclassified Tychonema]MBE9122316.1 hypothetical protein [Tychonema sp. LEGE 07199]MBE9133570.1 hypothetical protein [Tychonema sp. LEGE 07196]
MLYLSSCPPWRGSNFFLRRKKKEGRRKKEEVRGKREEVRGKKQCTGCNGSKEVGQRIRSTDLMDRKITNYRSPITNSRFPIPDSRFPIA